MKIQITLSDNFQDNLNTVAKLAEPDYNALKEGRFNFKQLVGLNNRSSDLDSEKKVVVERLLIHHQAERFYLLRPHLKLAH